MIKKFIEFKDYEKQNLILKMLFNNQIIDKRKIKNFHRKKKNTSITLLRNSCIFTKRQNNPFIYTSNVTYCIHPTPASLPYANASTFLRLIIITFRLFFRIEFKITFVT